MRFRKPVGITHAFELDGPWGCRHCGEQGEHPNHILPEHRHVFIDGVKNQNCDGKYCEVCGYEIPPVTEQTEHKYRAEEGSMFCADCGLPAYATHHSFGNCSIQKHHFIESSRWKGGCEHCGESQRYHAKYDPAVKP